MMKTAPLWLGLFCMLFAAAALAVEDRARVALVRGNVTAVDAQESARTLQRDDTVGPGDTVETGPKGLAQLVFPDRSMIYVKASSRLRIQAFHFDPATPEKDASVTEVLKGGMRALTGILGKRSPDKTRFQSRVSTIGIRGTALEIAEVGDHWRVTFDFGQGYAETPAGRTEIQTGESVRIYPGQRPSVFIYRRMERDPKVLVETITGMPPAAVVEWIGRQELEEEDRLFTLGMLRQSDAFTPAAMAATIRGFSGSLNLDQRRRLAEFGAQLYPDHAKRVLESVIRDKSELVPMTEAVLRGLRGQPQEVLDRVFLKAIDLGITEDQAIELLDRMRENPPQCR